MEQISLVLLGAYLAVCYVFRLAFLGTIILVFISLYSRSRNKNMKVLFLSIAAGEPIEVLLERKRGAPPPM